MTDPLHIPKGDRETVRLFALDLDREKAAPLAQRGPSNGTPDPLAEMLGAPALDRARVEVFPAADLKGVGLSGYVTDGLGVDEADVTAQAATLDAETGHIVVLHSGAVPEGTTLAPKPPLRHLATFRLAQPAAAAITPPVTPGDSAAPAPPPPTPQPGPPARMPRALTLLALLAAALVVLVLAYVFGISR